MGDSVQTHWKPKRDEDCATANSPASGDLRHATQWLPGPQPAAELARIDASLKPQSVTVKSVSARILVGTAVVAGAATIPDISVGAMDAPYFRVDVREPSRITQKPIWSPALSSGSGVAASKPVSIPVMAATTVMPSGVGLSEMGLSEMVAEDIRPGRGGEALPLNLIEASSFRFDQAFASVEMPSAATFTIARERPGASEPTVSADVPLRARLIDVPQITNIARIARPEAAARPGPRAPLSTSPSVEASVAAANEALASAFAGPLDVSRGARAAIETAPSQQTSAPQTSAPQTSAPQTSAPQTSVPQASSQLDSAARAVSVTEQETRAGQNGAAQSALVEKSQLDARVNGVLTGSVDFQQLDGTIAIRLGSVVDMLHDRFAPSELERISGAGALSSFVTLAQLQSAGIPIRYDPVYDEVEFGVDYDDAPHAAKVQMEQIGSPTVGSNRTGIEQIPR